MEMAVYDRRGTRFSSCEILSSSWPKDGSRWYERHGVRKTIFLRARLTVVLLNAFRIPKPVRFTSIERGGKGVDRASTRLSSMKGSKFRPSAGRSELAEIEHRSACSELVQIIHNLRIGPVHRDDELAANHAVAIDDRRFRITRSAIQVKAVFR